MISLAPCRKFLQQGPQRTGSIAGEALVAAGSVGQRRVDEKYFGARSWGLRGERGAWVQKPQLHSAPVAAIVY